MKIGGICLNCDLRFKEGMMQLITDRSEKMIEPCVATIGFFDGVHVGHQALIRQVKTIAGARQLKSALVTFPIHPRKVMQSSFCPELLTIPDEKVYWLSRNEVDYCFMLDFTPDLANLSAEEFMREVLKKQYHVTCLVIGYDHRFGHNRSETFEDYVRYGAAIGMEVVLAEAYASPSITQNGLVVNVSSSLIRELLHRGEVEMAGRALGYDYTLSGTVVSGYQMGRKIGFPTANIALGDPDKLLPRDGVYAVRVEVDHALYKGMLNIGVRPTMDNGSQRSVEVHILGFDGDIYDHSIRLTFVKRLRDEKKFDGIDQLIAQLHLDAEAADRAL